ncbi:MAG: hypothetical protein QM736_11300 [Vicinamibacterales bacterium]
MFQIVDSISHQRGAHALRAGVDIIYNVDDITIPRLYAACTRSRRSPTS